MKRAMIPTLIVASGTLFAVLVAVRWWHVEVRHSAPYGFSKTIDFERLIAVSGGYVTANYPDFDRIDIDVRGYDERTTFDVVLHIRPAKPGAPDIRTVRLDISGKDVPSRKGALVDPFTTIRFPPIADSAGETYYVWLERAPRNQDQVITVWSIKSYSTVPVSTVLRAYVSNAVTPWRFGWLQVLTAASVLGVAITGVICLARLVFIGFPAQTRSESMNTG